MLLFWNTSKLDELKCFLTIRRRVAETEQNRTRDLCVSKNILVNKSFDIYLILKNLPSWEVFLSYSAGVSSTFSELSGATFRDWISIFQPVSFAAKRTFWPPFPIARDC